MNATSEVAVVANEIAKLVAGGRVHPVVPYDVKWRKRGSPGERALLEVERVGAEAVRIATAHGFRELFVQICGTAQVFSNDSKPYTAVVVLVASPHYPARVVTVPTEPIIATSRA